MEWSASILEKPSSSKRKMNKEQPHTNTGVLISP